MAGMHKIPEICSQLHMDNAKIQLSKDELLMAGNAEIILTKNRIIRKVVELFSELSTSMREVVKQNEPILDPGIAWTEPRISKGEQYRELPWVMLDYPRIFGKEEIFAIRTLFWWGHEFSMTLHMKGSYFERFRERLKRGMDVKGWDGLRFYEGHQEWIHHVETGSHLPALLFTREEWIRRSGERNFLKLRVVFPLAEGQPGQDQFLLTFRNLLQVPFGVSSPGGERVP